MKIQRVKEVEAAPVSMEGADRVEVRVVLGRMEGAPNFTMRVFTLAPGGRTPYHRHDYEHEILVLSGRGILRHAEGRVVLAPGTAALVEPDEWHGFVADEEEGMEILCLVPNRAYVAGSFRVEGGAWSSDCGL